MDVEKTFHMMGGPGTTSYAKNSSLQKKASDMVKHITKETVQELYLTLKPTSFGIADLGCSSGPNTLSIIKDIIEAAEEIISPKILQNPSTAPEFRVYLNDLPTNDFNSIFRALPDFHREFKEARRKYGSPCPTLYMAASPGSFYGRLFPNRCLHFVYSSYSLHWLSKVPSGLYDEKGDSINKGCVYISKSSPPSVAKAYSTQFQEDFSSFLRFRSEEVIPKGNMLLILLGRNGPNHVDRGNYLFWEVLSRSLSLLVSKGEIEKNKLDSYDVHFYAPSKTEIQDEIEKEGSFELTHLEMLELGRNEVEGQSYGMAVATTVRAIQEPMISHHFGEGIIDELFQNYAKLVDEEIAKEDIRPITFVLVLRRL